MAKMDVFGNQVYTGTINAGETQTLWGTWPQFGQGVWYVAYPIAGAPSDKLLTVARTSFGADVNGQRRVEVDVRNDSASDAFYSLFALWTPVIPD